MYSKQEIQKIRQEFWTAFGQYMQPVLSTEGEKVNWINYKTGVKNIRISMDVTDHSAFIGFVISHTNKSNIYFNHFVSNKKIFEKVMNEKWVWEQESVNEYNQVESRIYKEIRNTSILNRENWPTIISFLKPRLIALDAFWSQARYGFEDL